MIQPYPLKYDFPKIIDKSNENKEKFYIDSISFL